MIAKLDYLSKNEVSAPQFMSESLSTYTIHTPEENSDVYLLNSCPVKVDRDRTFSLFSSSVFSLLDVCFALCATNNFQFVKMISFLIKMLYALNRCLE